jgi:TonB family protein
MSLPPRVETRPAFDRSEVIYYQPSEYLPPLDTRSASTATAVKADPVFAPQPIISVPPEAENSEQTIVTPPKIKLKQHLPLPNIVAWADAQQKPQLAIPDAPLTPAAEITRMAPTMTGSVVTPPPDAAQISDRRNKPALQNSVVAPPPDVRAASASVIQGLQPSLIAPPPALDAASNRRVGEINIAASAVIAPAPQLPVAPQRVIGPGALPRSQPQVVAPPPSISSGSSDAAFGSQGHVIALNLHPAVGAPPAPPEGNRRGSFAAGPEGHAAASGSPGSAAAATSSTGSASNGNGNGNGITNGGEKDNLPSGLYVGKANARPSSLAGPAAGSSSANTVNPNLMASVRPPAARTAATMQPDSATRLSEAERAVFGNRRFYSITLNMPNLNSAGGSWVIRFAELKHESPSRDSAAPDPALTQPMATRKVDPAYPSQLMRENIAGTVILYAVIHADGTVGDVRVLRSVDDRLDRFAAEAISRWKFEPATKNGTPVDVEATFQIPFRPARLGSNF